MAAVFLVRDHGEPGQPGALSAGASEALGGLTYAQFIAPAILCAATLNIAFSESSFGLFADLKWQRTLWGRLATPISPRIAADGYLIFITTRLTFTAATYYLVLTLFGLNGGWWGLLAIPVGIFHGLAVGVWVMTLTLHITKPDPTAFNLALRFGIIPMTLFSATYFPLSQLPGWAQIAAQASPLLHANELARGAILHNLSAGQIAWHLGFITVLFIVGRHVMIRSFIKRTVI